MSSTANFIVVQPALSRQNFLRLLIGQFPELAADVLDEDYEGLIHLQVGFLGQYANDLIRRGKFDVLKIIFDFFHTVVEQVDSSTENALYVSFLEHVDMDGESEKAKEARKLLQPKYLQVWRELRSQ